VTPSAGRTSARRALAALALLAALAGAGTARAETFSLAAGAAGDWFGASVAVSGDWAVIGAPFTGYDGSSGPGAAYFYTRGPGGWALHESIPGTGWYWGTAVAMEGDVAAVSTPYWKSYFSVDWQAGMVKLYQRNGSAWTPLRALDGTSGWEFGASLAISGNRIAVGILDRDSDAGAAQVHLTDGTSEGQLLPSDGAADSQFGASIDVDGDTVAVGAPRRDAGASGSGAVYVYERSGENWNETKLTAPADNPAGAFGTSVALSGNVLVVGAPDSDPSGAMPNSGAAYVFTRSRRGWAFELMLTQSDAAHSTYFGRSIEVRGAWLAVGAAHKWPNDFSVPGSVYPFALIGGQWQEQDKLRLDDPRDRDLFGTSVALSDAFIMAGGPGWDAKKGAVLAVAYPPILAVNNGLTVNEGGDGDVNQARLEATDASSGPEALTFTLSAVPANGALRRSGSALAVNGAFTQQDVNSGFLTYEHDGGETTSDSFAFTVTNGAGGSTAAKTFSIEVTPQNDAPTAVNLSAATVAENQASGTVLGALSADDPDAGDAHAYSLVAGDGDADNALFAIDGADLETAQVLDHETKPSCSIRVRADDGKGGKLEAQFAITVTNVNEAAADITIDSSEVDENQPAGTVIGTLGNDDPDAGDSHTYAFAAGDGDADNAQFALDGAALKTAAEFDRESSSAYSIRLQVDDGAGGTFQEALTITVRNVNEPPTALALDNADVDENLPGGSVVGLLSADDPDAGDAHTYALAAGAGDTDNASFAIAGANLVTAAAFDFEAKSSYNVRIQAEDAGGLPIQERFHVTVNNADEVSAVLFSDDFSTDKGWTGFEAGWWERGEATAGGGGDNPSPDPGDDHSPGDDNRIVGVNIGGDFPTVADGAHYLTSPAIDCSGQTSVKLRFSRWLNCWDEYGLNTDHLVQVYDGAAWRTVFRLRNLRLDESAWQQRAYDVSKYAADNAEFRVRFVYEFKDDFRGTWSGWNLDDVEVVALDDSPNALVDPDFEVGDTEAWSLNRSDGAKLYANLQWHGWETSMDSALRFYSTSSGDLTEGHYAGCRQDADLTGVNAIVFDVNFAQGTHVEARLLIDSDLVWSRATPGVAMDQSADVSGYDGVHTVELRMHCVQGGTATESEGVYFDNVRAARIAATNDPPTLVVNAGAAVDEGGSVLVDSAVLRAADDEQDDAGLVYTLTQAPAHGTLRRSGAPLAAADTFLQDDLDTQKVSYEHDGGETLADSFAFTVSDGAGGATGGATFTLTVTPQNDPPSDIGLSAASVDENLPAGTLVGTLSVTDPDPGDTHLYALTSGTGAADNASFMIDGAALKTAAPFDYETKSAYSVRIRVRDEAGESFEEAFSITVANVNETATAITLDNTEVEEHQPAGTVVGAFGNNDPDGGETYAYAFVAGDGDAGNGAFVIDGGVLKSAQEFDRAVQDAYSIRVRVDDAGRGAFTMQLLIAVVRKPEIALQLKWGWNLLSLPFDTGEATPRDLLVDDGGKPVFIGDAWVWDPDAQDHIETDALTAKQGFWVYCNRADGAVTKTIRGVNAAAELQLDDLTPLWNLVGSLDDRDKPEDWPTVWLWDGELGVYRPVKQLQRGVGCWVFK